MPPVLTTEQKIDADIAHLHSILSPLGANFLDSTRSILTHLYRMKDEAPNVMFHLLLEIFPPELDAATASGQLQVVFSPTINEDDSTFGRMVMKAAGYFGIISSLARSVRRGPRPGPSNQSTVPHVRSSPPASSEVVDLTASAPTGATEQVPSTNPPLPTAQPCPDAHITGIVVDQGSLRTLGNLNRR